MIMFAFQKDHCTVWSLGGVQMGGERQNVTTVWRFFIQVCGLAQALSLGSLLCRIRKLEICLFRRIVLGI